MHRSGLGVKATASARSSVFLPGETSRLPPAGGSHRGRKDEVTTRREESDGRTVPQGRRKAVPTAERPRGGRATTASDMAAQLGLFPETAATPQGAGDAAEAGQAARARRPVPKAGGTTKSGLPAMTMEEVTSEANL